MKKKESITNSLYKWQAKLTKIYAPCTKKCDIVINIECIDNFVYKSVVKDLDLQVETHPRLKGFLKVSISIRNFYIDEIRYDMRNSNEYDIVLGKIW